MTGKPIPHPLMPSAAGKALLAALLAAILLAGAPWSARATVPVRVGVYENRPLVFQDQDGSYTGIAIDILKHIAEEEKWQLVFAPGTWPECLERLKSGDIDLLAAIAYSNQRARRFDFTRETVINNWGRLFVPPGSPVDSILDLEGKRVATLENDIHARVFSDNIKKFNLKVTLIPFQSYDEVLRATAAKRVEAGLVNRLFAMRKGAGYAVEKTSIIFNPIEVRYAATRGRHRLLLAVIDRHLEAMRNDKDSPYYQTLESWFIKRPERRMPVWAGWLILATILGLILTGIATLVLRAAVRTKTAELTAEIAERRKAEAALRAESQRTMAEKNRGDAIIAALGDGLSIQDREFRIIHQNQVHQDLAGDHIGAFCYEAYEHNRQVCDGCPVAMAFADGRVHTVERSLTRDGAPFHVEITVSPLFNPDGEIVAGVELVRDITERRQAEEERESLREQLLQAQKMESIGRLAGGVAHDFNNLLSAIIGYSELVLLNLPAGSPLAKDIQAIHDSGEKAAALTRQLLAFSRRQVLEIKVLDLNRVIDHLNGMLKRLLGEDIELLFQPGQNLNRVEADQVQMEQVLMNLAVNARDAMPEGGRLIIKTANIELDEAYCRQREGIRPGDYLLLSVTDTGAGMAPEVRERIFEPFFTTKEQGKGTGLGLATIYGIVKQHNGHIWVYSEPGSGTAFHIYLPAVEAEATMAETSTNAPLPRGSETILVVDDVAEVRNLIRDALEPQGYEVLTAASATEALEIVVGASRPLDLLVTDLVMPGMNGRELAAKFQQLAPHGRVMFMSGYTDNHIVLKDIGDQGICFLQKPIVPQALIRAVRTVLDEEGPARA